MEILKIAASQLGLEEIKGTLDNPQILAYATETGIAGVTNDEIAWCSTFVNWRAKKAGLPMSGKPNARSWLNVGKATTQPQPGDVVVFWREDPHSWKGHVGIFMGFNKTGTQVFCLGGNQSNKVCITPYDAAKVLGYRQLKPIQTLSIPKPNLALGSKGAEVIKLQLALTHLGYPCGDADGNFGQKTADALKLLQANNRIKIDGSYGEKSKNCIESLLQS